METIFTLPTTISQWAILTVLLISFCIQISYYIHHTLFFKKEKEKTHSLSKDAVSIIICAKNEAHYLEENLSGFLNQNYFNYEVIVVNDGSEDETDNIISRYRKDYPHLRSTTIPLDEKFRHNKKLALSIGIKAAKNEKLVFTNIQSKASSNNWLQNFMDSWEKGVHLGYVNFENKKGLFYNFLRFDLLTKYSRSAIFASLGKAHSGNGANLGYKKSDFFSNKGFQKHAHFEAGYDHLMVLQLAGKSGASVCINPEAKINLPSENAYQQWVKINRDYYKCRKYIPLATRLKIDLEPFSALIFYLSILCALFFPPLYLWGVVLFLSKIIFTGRLFKISTRHLKEENLFLSSCIYDFLVLFSKIYFSCTNFIFPKRNQWK
ncbi:glycosyltransferase [Labilibaculum sp.]|uniref:glycosyltransferase n=1 Tax=Labilibaculum sp. TaxID=2060723 RepID=UPI00356B535A